MNLCVRILTRLLNTGTLLVVEYNALMKIAAVSRHEYVYNDLPSLLFTRKNVR
jgi:hypothetical protein